MRFELDRYRLPPGPVTARAELPAWYPRRHQPGCCKCGKPGHYAKTCQVKQRRCGRCGDVGHYAKTCFAARKT